nr:DUF2793 domain-containing protein [Roseomonas sp. GC11]
MNDAFTRVDAVAQLTVRKRTLSAAPSAPAEGECWIVAAQATDMPSDPWLGKVDMVAAYYGGWRFLAPTVGWTAWVQDEAAPVWWTGATWQRGTQGATKLNELLDVDLPSAAPTDKDVLFFDAAKGAFTSGPNPAQGGSSTLAGLTDVALGTPAQGQVLTFDLASQKWRGAAPTASTGSPLVAVQFSGKTLAIGASKNIASITRRGIGRYRLNFSAPVPITAPTTFGGKFDSSPTSAANGDNTMCMVSEERLANTRSTLHLDIRTTYQTQNVYVNDGWDMDSVSVVIHATS